MHKYILYYTICNILNYILHRERERERCIYAERERARVDLKGRDLLDAVALLDARLGLGILDIHLDEDGLVAVGSCQRAVLGL